MCLCPNLCCKVRLGSGFGTPARPLEGRQHVEHCPAASDVLGGVRAGRERVRPRRHVIKEALEEAEVADAFGFQTGFHFGDARSEARKELQVGDSVVPEIYWKQIVMAFINPYDFPL